MKITIPDTLRITNPLWVEKLESRETWEEVNEICEVRGKKLSILDYECCIVGETLNLFDKNWMQFKQDFNGDTCNTSTSYHNGCSECASFSMSLFHKVENMKWQDNIDELEIGLYDYANHLELYHKDIIEEAKKRNG